MKKANRFISILVNLLTTLSVILALFTVVSVLTVNKSNRSLLGYKFYVCLSDSMKATDFAAGDLVVSKAVDLEKLEEGDIITFISTDPSSAGQTVTHKIKEITKQGSLYRFTTYGTTTGTVDPTPVDGINVLGQYKFHIPKLGLFFNFVKTTPGYICCILVPFLFIILVQLVNTVKIFREYKKEESRQIEDEKKKLEEERKRNEELLREANEKLAQLQASQGIKTKEPANSSEE